MKSIIDSDLFHGLVIVAIFALLYSVHRMLTRREVTTKAGSLYFGVAIVSSFFVYRLVINPML